jgi:acyl-coenzyme A synthetase/AMP-(fatty) acid ligase
MEEVCAVAVPADSLAARWQDCPQAVARQIEAEVEQLARELTPYKRPSRLYIHPGELPRTPSRKISRPLVHRWLDERDHRRAS